jgi:hypothetical protein
MPVVIEKKKEATIETVTVEPIVANIEVEKKSGKTSVEKTETQEHLEDVIVTKKMANIGFKGGMTFNLGDFNSARVDVSLYYPCEIDQLDETYEKVKAWVDSKIEKIVQEVKG